jgi:hypothetical protein
MPVRGSLKQVQNDMVWRTRIMSDLTLASDDLARTMDPAMAVVLRYDDAQTLEGISMSSWYRAWIFVQSSLLRVAPFTWHHQTRLGIACPTPTMDDAATYDVAQGSLLRPHLPFCGDDWNIAFWRKLLTITNVPPLHVIFNTFGPLGPTFRGRDRMESHVLYLSTVVGAAIGFATMDPNEYTRGPTTNFRPFLRQWATGQESVLQCLLQQHEKIRRTRPMTVVPPLLTLRPIPTTTTLFM